MNINKIILSAASVAAMTLVACGSDSSPSGSNSGPSATLPENGRVQTGLEVNNYLCSTTENQCEKIFVEDVNVTMQCSAIGTWAPMVLDEPVEGCSGSGSNSTPGGDSGTPSNESKVVSCNYTQESECEEMQTTNASAIDSLKTFCSNTPGAIFKEGSCDPNAALKCDFEEISKKLSLYFYTLPVEGMTCADVDFGADSGDDSGSGTNPGTNDACASIEDELISSGCLDEFLDPSARCQPIVTKLDNCYSATEDL